MSKDRFVLLLWPLIGRQCPTYAIVLFLWMKPLEVILIKCAGQLL